ncbi:ADP-ribosylglycohydrolase-domain-containing protein [Mycena leptocephala]|nr:ADP-ribosylglycohydrolase-domain-containing protein [Mycena leptocephala]
MTDSKTLAMNDAKVLDRAQGALFGTALGDAIGIYTEFMMAEEAVQAYGSPSPNFTLSPPETKLRNDPHRCRFESRAWTDDTDHTILMMLSYLRLREFSPADFAIRLRSWCEQGLRVLDRPPMGLGKTVGSVVSSQSFGSNPAVTALRYWNDNGRKIAPNGSLMRTTPVGVICIHKTETETFAAAILMGAVTHADPRCALSVAIVSALVRALCRGEVANLVHVEGVIERAWAHFRETLPGHAELLDRQEFERHANAESLGALQLDSALEMGYTFRSAIVKLVMCGGDADTNGAVAGALMGALYGYADLPTEWRDGMRHGEWYRGKIMALCCVAGLSDGVYDSESDLDTELDGGKGFLSEKERQRRELGIMERMRFADDC